ncbi:unnamed protein product [Vicia faba]|uniref:Uncharacterized protein n=1 Tax=Vicia faba TaxID=3906 RepID=A0AAV1AH92_VICFA|nr:unnamed protein product [Vicia faba]
MTLRLGLCIPFRKLLLFRIKFIRLFLHPPTTSINPPFSQPFNNFQQPQSSSPFPIFTPNDFRTTPSIQLPQFPATPPSVHETAATASSMFSTFSVLF